MRVACVGVRGQGNTHMIAVNEAMGYTVLNREIRNESRRGGLKYFLVFATGAPPGLGSHVHWDRKLDGLLAQALMSIQAVKGVEIGDGFALAGTAAIQVFFYLATMGILSLLVMYVVTNVGALRYLFLGEARRAPRCAQSEIAARKPGAGTTNPPSPSTGAASPTPSATPRS